MVKATGANVSGTVLVNDAGDIFTAGYFYSTPVDFDPSEDTFSVSRIGTLDGFILKLKWCTLSDTITQTSCKSFTYKDVTYNESGVYTVPNPEGCDSASVTVLNLTIYNLNPVINVNGFTLGTVNTYATYQWLLNGNTIPGATSRYYTVNANGDYQVVVSNNNGCVDTSDIYTVNNAGVEDIPTLAKSIRVYPNPATDIVHIQSPVDVQATLLDVTGKEIRHIDDARSISMKGLASGLYMLRITDRNGVLIKVAKVVKQGE